ncbi:Molecular chaperone, HSP90 family [Candidatus Methanophagaceae archaeon]|nr:Molecular chaperone, HSP90 family [Methanophagales archaeon]
MKTDDKFSFEISLSVLNHLGRNLYRSFITVLGEAISNSWDADAPNVWIYVDKEKNSFVIKDDGTGMSKDDFQNKFLKIGYSKRKDGKMESDGGRPFIGKKGIGKLALLSCADKITVISKTEGMKEYVGGVIDNSDLDNAIRHDLTPDKCSLGPWESKIFEKYTDNHEKGTIIHFEQTKENIRNTIPYLKKLIALYFKFSLIDERFDIFVYPEKVTVDDLKDLSKTTEFLWNINGLKDPYIDTLSALEDKPINISNSLNIAGFMATVKKPRYLKITGTGEKAGIDLFVNGRLRERDILKHMPDFSTRHVASYLYGQIHFNELDATPKDDPFTSSRESIVPGDPKYEELLKILKEKILKKISDEWDNLRLSRGEEGDDENPRKTIKERKAASLYNLSSKDYTGESDVEIKNWIKELQPDAEFDIPAYVDCFLSENLIRKYVEENKISLSSEAEKEIRTWQGKEATNKGKGNVSIDIRKRNTGLSYLSMDGLATLVDNVKNDPKKAGLSRDASEYKPIRDALMHTALLTDEAKGKLTSVYENIKGRVKKLLSSDE